MTHYSTVTVTDVIGQTFALSDCTILCARCGDLDYSDPVAVIYPDGETLVHGSDLDLMGPNFEALELDDLDYSDGDGLPVAQGPEGAGHDLPSCRACGFPGADDHESCPNCTTESI